MFAVWFTPVIIVTCSASGIVVDEWSSRQASRIRSETRRLAVPETTVIHVNEMQPGDVYIGRALPRRGLFKSSPFANPFRIGRDGNRAEVIEKYRTWLLGQPILVSTIPELLQGRRLACWCAPEACHGHVLAQLADAAGKVS